MQTYTAATITAVIESCPNRRTAIAWARSEADALIEQAERRAKGYDRGLWRDDCRPCDRARYNRIATVTHASVETAFALARRFA